MCVFQAPRSSRQPESDPIRREKDPRFLGLGSSLPFSPLSVSVSLCQVSDY